MALSDFVLPSKNLSDLDCFADLNCFASAEYFASAFQKQFEQIHGRVKFA